MGVRTPPPLFPSLPSGPPEPPTGFMVVTAGEVYRGMVNGRSAFLVDHKKAEGVEEKWRRGDILHLFIEITGVLPLN